MPRWQSRIDEQLLEGESIVDTVEVDSTLVVVTGKRVLILAPPDSDTPTVQSAPRSNVGEITQATRGNRRNLRRGTILGIVGGVSLVAGTLVNVENYVPGPSTMEADGASRFGGGDIVEFMQTVLWIVVRLDEGLQLFGVFCLVLALAAASWYWLAQRTPTLEIEIEGDGTNLTLPRPSDSERLTRELQRALTADQGTTASEQDDVL